MYVHVLHTPLLYSVSLTHKDHFMPIPILCCKGSHVHFTAPYSLSPCFSFVTCLANGKAAKRVNCLHSSGVLLVNEIRDGLEGTMCSRWPSGIVCLGHASRLTALAWHCRHWLQTLFMWLPHAYKSVHCLLLVGRATCVPTYFSTLHLTPLLRPAV